MQSRCGCAKPSLLPQEAEQMREADGKKKEAVQVKNDAETLCYQAARHAAPVYST